MAYKPSKLERLVCAALLSEDAVGWDILRTYGEVAAARHIFTYRSDVIKAAAVEALREYMERRGLLTDD